MKSNKSARELALDSILSFCGKGRYSNLEVDATLRSYGAELTPADRGLYTRLVYGTVERMITLDYVIGAFSNRPVGSIDPTTLGALRLGLCQLMYMDKIPPHAAVSESVELAPARSRGFVNGILRSYLRAAESFSLPEDDMSVKYSVSRDISELLTDCYGRDEAAKILASSFGDGKVSLRVNTLRLTVQDAVRLLDGTRVSLTASDVLLLPSLTEEARDGIMRGLWFVQDESSRNAVEALGARPGDTVADVCAAPGGKSFSAAIDMENVGKIFAFDLHKNKLSLIRHGAKRLGITVIDADARDAGEPEPSLIGKCDRVICDAPCSGLGVMSKKPEIRYKRADELSRLPDVQLRVLHGASEYVKKGGVLVYSTCTLNRRENEDVVRRFLEQNDRFSTENFELAASRLASENGMLTIFPHISGSDGFFIARMRAAE